MVTEDFIVPEYAEVEQISDEWGAKKTVYVWDDSILLNNSLYLLLI